MKSLNNAHKEELKFDCSVVSGQGWHSTRTAQVGDCTVQYGPVFLTNYTSFDFVSGIIVFWGVLKG